MAGSYYLDSKYGGGYQSPSQNSNYLGAGNLSQDVGSPEVGGAMVGGGASAAAMSNPYTAALMIGGSFLTNYMAQKAQEREKAREREMQARLAEGQASANSGQMQQHALDSLMNNYRAALR